MKKEFNLIDFLEESLHIEGIHREPTKQEIAATEDFLALEELSIDGIKALVSIYQPDAVLRVKAGLNVRVGNYYPPKGSEKIETSINALLEEINRCSRIFDMIPEIAAAKMHEHHIRYEKLHPFTDGNGRSGRALWLWEMNKLYPHKDFPAPLGFLHTFYYQTLSNSR